MTTLAIFRAAFLADSLSLGAHWIYNQEKIARLYPDGITDFDSPRSSYHPNRRRGDFTHYGDQMLILAQSLAATSSWSQAAFTAVWQSRMSGFDGYLDGASKTTLDNLAAGLQEPASDSNDLAGASRVIPVLALSAASLPEKVIAAREQTGLTHGDDQVIDAAEFFVRALDALQEGSDLPSALALAAEAPYKALPAQEWLAKATAALSEEDHLAVASKFGLTCHLPEAFPLALYYALRWHQQGEAKGEQDFLKSLSDDALAGGDTSARTIPHGALMAAAGCAVPSALWQSLKAYPTLSALETLLIPARPESHKISFTGAQGTQLDGRLELPVGPPKAFALFAHCFTCGMASHAATAISRALAARGIATLRFDFTGLGGSDGDFANTSFISNVEDLVAATAHLREHFAAPSLLIGHSLGGAAVLAAAGKIPEITHVATIGAPSDPSHVTHLFEKDLPTIKKEGQAEVTLAGRKFTIGERFLTDLNEHDQAERIAALARNLLILHSPKDSIVGIENAGRIYSAAQHPKSFVALPNADHLLTDRAEGEYAAELIATWTRA